MPSKGVSKSESRSCLICGDATRIAHLGIDACRACAVFYRRAKSGNDYTCRSGKDDCAKPERVRICKGCRFARISELISHSTNKIAKVSSKSGSPSLQQNGETPLIARIKAEYKAMCFAQLSSELHARGEVPHPMQMSVDEGPFYPADFASLALANRIVLAASLRFGIESFPEFSGLPDADKWKIVKSFMYPFRILEGSYRANKLFPNELNKYFASYTTFFITDAETNFFSTAPKPDALVDVEKYLHSPEFANMGPEARNAMKRVNPAVEEYLALVLLTFWNIEHLDVCEDALHASARYREAILKELHVIYRETLQIQDYAARLGEIIMLLQTFEKTKTLQEHFEVFRLFSDISDNDFTCLIHRE